MHAIEFPEQTLIIAKDQPQYNPLPAHVTPDGVVTFAFELTDEEIARLVETRTLWVRKLTFCQPLQPINIMVEKPTFEITEPSLPKCDLCGRILDQLSMTCKCTNGPSAGGNKAVVHSSECG